MGCIFSKPPYSESEVAPGNPDVSGAPVEIEREESPSAPIEKEANLKSLEPSNPTPTVQTPTLTVPQVKSAVEKK